MEDLEMLKRAKFYIDNMANGVNPVTGEAVPETDSLNNIKISRCLFFVSGVLREALEKKPEKGKKPKKVDFYMTEEEIANFRIDSEESYIGNFAKSINEYLADENRKKITYRAIVDWLIANGYLSESEGSDGKRCKVPTYLGDREGFESVDKVGSTGIEYQVIVIREKAKKLILNHINDIAKFKKNSGEGINEFNIDLDQL